MLDELRNLFLRALKCDDGFTATVLVDEWNEAVKRVQNVFDNMTDKDPNAVPVVRCKDCKYCRRVDEFEYWCEGFCSPARLVRKDDFCSHGNLND